jgi:hypothetical protein
MKNCGVSLNTAPGNYLGVSGAYEQSANDLATVLAIMHAALESTTDAILVTDEANYVRHFNEKYINLWEFRPI